MRTSTQKHSMLKALDAHMHTSLSYTYEERDTERQKETEREREEGLERTTSPGDNPTGLGGN